MANRLELHTLLCDILGSRNVYYQPPQAGQLQYPAIVYAREKIENLHAGNRAYLQNLAYSITVIDKNPDSDVVMQLSRLPKCKHNKH